MLSIFFGLRFFLHQIVGRCFFISALTFDFFSLLISNFSFLSFCFWLSAVALAVAVIFCFEIFPSTHGSSLLLGSALTSFFLSRFQFFLTEFLFLGFSFGWDERTVGGHKSCRKLKSIALLLNCFLLVSSFPSLSFWSDRDDLLLIAFFWFEIFGF